VRTLPLPFYDISLRPFKKYCTARVAATAAGGASSREEKLCGKKEENLHKVIVSPYLLPFYCLASLRLPQRALISLPPRAEYVVKFSYQCSRVPVRGERSSFQNKLSPFFFSTPHCLIREE
jgi:hypothetical protein